MRLGYARVYTEGEFAKEDYYVRLEEEAKREGKGLWSALKRVDCVKIADVNYDAPGDDRENPNGEFVVVENECSFAGRCGTTTATRLPCTME